jgi:hypothetical protein
MDELRLLNEDEIIKSEAWGSLLSSFGFIGMNTLKLSPPKTKSLAACLSNIGSLLSSIQNVAKSVLSSSNTGHVPISSLSILKDFQSS